MLRSSTGLIPSGGGDLYVGLFISGELHCRSEVPDEALPISTNSHLWPVPAASTPAHGAERAPALLSAFPNARPPPGTAFLARISRLRLCLLSCHALASPHRALLRLSRLPGLVGLAAWLARLLPSGVR